MRRQSHRFALFGLTLTLAALSCAFPALPGSAKAQRTALAGTVFILQTRLSSSQTAVPVPPTTTPFPPPTMTDTATPLPPLLTPQPTTVIQDALCWLGPGPDYEVSSTIRARTQVTLLGRGIIIGWWVIENPIYHDPCWVEQYNVQVDPRINLYALKVYKVPVIPTPTLTLTPKPSKTPTP